MAYLSETASNDLAWVIGYVVESNGLEKPSLDATSMETLARHYVEFGYARQIELLENLRDRPFWTLLDIFLKLDAVSPELEADERAQLQVAADSVKSNFSPGEPTYQAFLNFAHLRGTGSDIVLLNYVRDEPLITLLLFIIAVFGTDASIVSIAQIGALSDVISLA
jgi:hypothetical protein